MAHTNSCSSSPEDDSFYAHHVTYELQDQGHQLETRTPSNWKSSEDQTAIDVGGAIDYHALKFNSFNPSAPPLTKAMIEAIELSEEEMNKWSEDCGGNDFRNIGFGIDETKAKYLVHQDSRRKLKEKRSLDMLLHLGKPGKRFPLFVILLTVAQITELLIFLIKFGFATVPQNPMIGPPVSITDEYGATNTALIRQDKQIYRLITAWIFHYGIIDLAFTLLWQLGIILRTERKWGWLRMGIVVFLSGTGGYLLSAVLLADQINVGSISCLIGVMGALVAEILLNWYATPVRPWQPLIGLFTQIMLFLAMGYLPMIDNYANFGGIICGFLSGIVVGPRNVGPSAKVERRIHKISILVRSIAFVLLVCYFALLLGVVLGAVKWSCKVCFVLSPGWNNY
jgi:membrane associated rhomboid family serine protease